MLIMNRLFIIIISFVFVNNITGVIYKLFNIKWGFSSIIISLFVSIIITYIYRNKLILIRKIEAYFCLFISIFILLIYMYISPVTELWQDPAVYMFKALNLVNYGYTYMPITSLSDLFNANILMREDYLGYAKIFNGTQIVNDVLETDFYPGSAFLFATLGLIYKPLIFYGSTVLMILNGMVMFLVLNQLVNRRYLTNTIFTLAFFVTPLIVFFGRGPYSEPIALLHFLFLVLMLSKLNMFNSIGIKEILIFFAVISSMTARIDYSLLFIVSVFVLALYNEKVGFITLFFGIIFFYMLKNAYPIYYERIILNDMPYIEYTAYISILAYFLGLFFKNVVKNNIDKLIYNKFTAGFVIILGILILSLYFREYVSKDSYQVIFMHGREMRSYSEAILYSLYNVFPFFIIIVGFLFLYKMLNVNKYNKLMIIFIFSLFIPYCMLFVSAGNSPQLYWFVRRYYNILIPVLFISFVLSTSGLKNRFSILIAMFTFVYSVIFFVDTRQIPDYEGMNYSLKKIDSSLRKENLDVIIYDKEDSYPISSIISYCGIEGIPVDISNVSTLNKLKLHLKNKNYIIMTRKKMNDKLLDEFILSYRKLGETYKEVPKEVYNRAYTFYAYKK